MTLLLVSSDSKGGAAKAALRLHRGINEYEVNSKLLVQEISKGDHTIVGPQGNFEKIMALIRPTLESFIIPVFAGGTNGVFSIGLLPFSTSSKSIARLKPDIVHLHWVCSGFLFVNDLRQFKVPIVWTLHDMWPFTGGCHNSAGCESYVYQCCQCPMLKRSGNWDLSRYIFYRKSKAWEGLNITIVTPSRWLADCAERSKLFKDRCVRIIPNGIDLDIYKPTDTQTSRRIWSLPHDKKLMLFGAINPTADRVKGFDLLLESIRNLKDKSKFELVVFGASKPSFSLDIGLPVRYLGRLHDDISLSLLYSAVDVTVVPSREESLSYTAIESLASCTPVVAFATSGLPDVIDHRENGYLAKPFDCTDLAAGIEWVVDEKTDYQRLSRLAREKAVARFDIRKVAKQYIELYESLI